MNKPRHPVDEFFSESLKNYKVSPTEGAENAFLQEAEGIAKTFPGNKSRKKWIYLTLPGIILIAFITGIFISRSYNKGIETYVNKNKSTVKSKQDETFYPEQSAGIQALQSTNNTHRNSTKSHPSGKSSMKMESVMITSSVSVKVGNMSSSSDAITISEKDFSFSDGIRRLEPVYMALIYAGNYFITPTEINNELTLNTIIKPSNLAKNNSKKNSFQNEDESLNLRTHLFSGGMYYSPEWMFNILEANKNMRADNLGLEGTFHFGPYSIGTAIGISITKGTNEIIIGYNDYLGTYKGLDSIVFKWDASHTHVIPVYYYTNKVVYDTSLKVQYAYYEKRYIYLQIPIKLGYDFLRTKMFTLGLRVGPTLSVLLQSSGKSNSIDLGKDRLVKLNDVTPERVETNWQISAGINAGIRLSRRFGLELEPEIRYYFNSVYEKPDNNKKPWSAGFRVALLFKH